jgi:mannose-1-phosphate guanylyltransferase
MKAMVLAAGLGTRLMPLTARLPKPMMPVLDRPALAHIVDGLERHGYDELVANLHHHPDAIQAWFGDRLEYLFEEELLGTAGAVRNAAGFFGDEPIVVVSGDSLNEVAVTELVDSHRASGAVATIVAQRTADIAPYGALLVAEDGRVTGLQEKPHPAEALSDLASCGIYCFSREVFEYFPEPDPVDWAQDVFPVLLENDVPVHAFQTAAYWNDIGTPAKLREANWRALEATGGSVWIGEGCDIEEGAELVDRVVIGAGSRVGAGAVLRDTVLFAGSRVPAGAVLVDGVGRL